MGTIYHCLTKDEKYIPVRHILTHEAHTEEEAIKYLQDNGGGIYRNILHRFDCRIDGVNKNESS